MRIMYISSLSLVKYVILPKKILFLYFAGLNTKIKKAKLDRSNETQIFIIFPIKLQINKIKLKLHLYSLYL